MAKVNRDFLEPEVAVSIARRELAEFEANDPSSSRVISRPWRSTTLSTRSTQVALTV